MLTKEQEKVLKKVTSVLEENNILYQLTAGLAAIAYGSKRPLFDIDIDVYKKDMLKVQALFKDYLVKELYHFQDNYWEGWLITFNIDGVSVDISQIEEWYAVSPDGKKVLMTGKPENARILEVANMKLPVIEKDILIEYKKVMARPTDLEDVNQIS